MAKKVNLGSTKRFGPRYGRRNKDKIASLENEHRGRSKCPYCNYVKVRRLSRGIWQCEKCNAKFAGRAYTFTSPKKSSPVLMKSDANSKKDDFEKELMEIEEETKKEIAETEQETVETEEKVIEKEEIHNELAKEPKTEVA